MRVSQSDVNLGNLVLVWSRDGLGIDPNYYNYDACYVSDWQTSNYARIIKFDKTGTYKIKNYPGDKEITVNVVQYPQKNYAQFLTTNKIVSDEFEQTLKQYDLSMTKEAYYLDRHITLRDYARIVGGHLVRIPNGDYQERMFRGANGMKWMEVTFEGNDGLLFHEGSATNNYFYGCIFKGLLLRQCDMKGSVFEKCTFINCGVGCEAWFNGCKWFGSSPTVHAIAFDSLDNPNIALTRCVLRETDRGIITRCKNLQEICCCGIRMHDISNTMNGNEVFLVEGSYKCENGLFIDWQVKNCQGVFKSENDFNGNYVIRMDFDGRSGIEVKGDNNIFQGIQLMNGSTIYIDGINELIDVYQINYYPHWCNQMYPWEGMLNRASWWTPNCKQTNCHVWSK